MPTPKLPLLLAALLLHAPLALASPPPDAAGSASEACEGAVPDLAPVPCTLTLDVRVHMHACALDECPFTLVSAATGQAAQPGLLGLRTTLTADRSVSAANCLGEPLGSVAEGHVRCSQVCREFHVGTSATCSGQVDSAIRLAPGACGTIVVQAGLDYNYVEGAGAVLLLTLCR